MPEIDIQILKLLSDIYTSARRILVMLENESRESFLDSSAMTVQDAVARRFTIIGEASSVLLRKYPEFCHKYEILPLRQARGMRNFLVHDYDGIDWEWVWDSSMTALPGLIEAVEDFLSDHE